MTLRKKINCLSLVSLAPLVATPLLGTSPIFNNSQVKVNNYKLTDTNAEQFFTFMPRINFEEYKKEYHSFNHFYQPATPPLYATYDIATNVDENGWATLDGINTFKQIFINEKVAQYFADWAARTPGEQGEGDINERLTSDLLTNAILNLGTEMDLSCLYLNDKFADDTVKALNNPNLYSFFLPVTKINLSNNGLWMVPLFGCSGIYDSGGEEEPISQVDEAFQNLSFLDLTHNHITKLPSSSEKVKGVLKETYKYDITKVGKKTPPGKYEIKVHVDDNYLMKNPKDSATSNYNNLGNIIESEYESDPSLRKQSTNYFINFDYLIWIVEEMMPKNGENISDILPSWSPDEDYNGNTALIAIYCFLNGISQNFFSSDFISSWWFGDGKPIEYQDSSWNSYVFVMADDLNGEFDVRIDFRNSQKYDSAAETIEQTPPYSLYFSFTSFKKDQTSIIVLSVVIAIFILGILSSFIYIYVKKQINIKKRER